MRSSGCRTPTAARPLRVSIAPGSPAGYSPTLSVASCRARLPSRARWASGSRWMSWCPATFCSGGRARASTTWASTPATASTSTPPRRRPRHARHLRLLRPRLRQARHRVKMTPLISENGHRAGVIQKLYLLPLRGCRANSAIKCQFRNGGGVLLAK